MKIRGSFITAAVMAVAVAGWVVSGQLGGDDRRAQAQKPPAELGARERVTQVRVRTQTAETYAAGVVLRGRTEALRTVDLKAETFGQIEGLKIKRGDRVTRGQIIVQLDPESRPAKVKEAKALLEQRRLEYEAASRLKEKGFRAETQFAAARAALDAAAAEVQSAEIDLANTLIRAPFEGTVDERMIELGDFVEKGDSIVKIVDLDPILIVGEVNEREIDRVRVETIGQARLISGLEVAGRVRFVSSIANAQTRTFRVELEVPNPDGAIPDGVSAELRLPLDEVMAHLVSPAILTLNDQGVIGVMTLESGDRVRFRPVELVDSTPEGLWLGGLPDEVTFVTVGQEFVKDGQQVKPVDEENLGRMWLGETS